MGGEEATTRQNLISRYQWSARYRQVNTGRLPELALEIEYDWHVAVLSIDDFYLTKAERNQLAQNIHPLLVTRGVPGTHDVQMLTDCVERLRALEPGNTMARRPRRETGRKFRP